MLEITEREDGFALFKVDSKLYDMPTLMEVSKEFIDVCWIYFESESDSSILISIKPKDPEIDSKDCVHSFMDYVLGIVAGRHKV